MRLAAFALSVIPLSALGCAPLEQRAGVVSAQSLAALDSLLAAERAFSEAAAGRTPAAGIAAMMDDDVHFIAREGMIRGRSLAEANLAANPSNAGQFARWETVRAGVSADGQHGFTFGYLDIEGGDPARAHRRYLSYWIKRPAGWRVLAFRQVLRPAAEPRIAMLPPSMPSGAPPSRPADPSTGERSLAAAEQAFSDRAQLVGLRQAFREFGSEDAVNIYGERGFSLGLEAIGRIFSEATSSPVRWSSDRTWVAASDDLGLSVGTLRANGPPTTDTPAEQPYFTIWRRDKLSGWKYVAE